MGETMIVWIIVLTAVAIFYIAKMQVDIDRMSSKIFYLETKQRSFDLYIEDQKLRKKFLKNLHKMKHGKIAEEQKNNEYEV